MSIYVCFRPDRANKDRIDEIFASAASKRPGVEFVLADCFVDPPTSVASGPCADPEIGYELHDLTQDEITQLEDAGAKILQSKPVGFRSHTPQL